MLLGLASLDPDGGAGVEGCAPHISCRDLAQPAAEVVNRSRHKGLGLIESWDWGKNRTTMAGAN
jgi:hypothetical protein